MSAEDGWDWGRQRRKVTLPPHPSLTSQGLRLEGVGSSALCLLGSGFSSPVPPLPGSLRSSVLLPQTGLGATKSGNDSLPNRILKAMGVSRPLI